MHDIESTNVLLSVHDDTRSAHVTPTSDHDNVAGVKLDVVSDFALLKVELDSIVDRDQGVRITDGSAIVGDDMRDAFGTDGDPANLQKLVRRFFRRDTVDSESALHVVEKTEVLARLLNGNDICITRLSGKSHGHIERKLEQTHKTSGVGLVGTNFAVDFDQALLDDGCHFSASQGILQSVAEEDGEREGFAKFVGTRRGARGLPGVMLAIFAHEARFTYVCAAKLVQHP